MALDGLELVNSVKSVSRETEERLTVFHDLLKQWQAHINLIAPSTIDQIWERHIADSMQSVVLLEGGSHIIDLGSGAGFPGLVMAIVLAEKGHGKIEFIESVGKKCEFIKAVARETGLRKTGVELVVHNGRIEKILPDLEQPDAISARALASLPKLLEMTCTKLENGAVGIFPKGREHIAEIEAARRVYSFDLDIVPSRFEAGSVLLKISDLKRL